MRNIDSRTRRPRFDLHGPVPPTSTVNGIPLYALDKHTRLGREAIRRFTCENAAARQALEEYVPSKARTNAAYMTAFYTDATPISRRLAWSHSAEVEALGTEADMMKVGAPKMAITPLLRAFQENLSQLNEVRTEVFVRARRGDPR